MKKSVILASMMAVMAPFGLQALTLTINGETYQADVTSFTANQTSISIQAAGLIAEILASNGVGDDGGNPPIDDGSQDGNQGGNDSPGDGNCDTSGVEAIDDVNWGYPAGQTRISLKNQIKSTRFTTTSNPNYTGQVSVASTTGTSKIQREVWISACPGQPPSEVPAGCKRTGTSSTVVYWHQKPGYFCQLDTNTQYYINYRNVDCPTGSSCDIYRNLYNNANP